MDDAADTKGSKPTGGRPKGGAKFGGRKKGTPNKARALLREALEDHGFDMASEIIEAIKCVPRQQRMAALAQLLPYLYPRLKETEPPKDIEEPLAFRARPADILSIVGAK